MYTNDELLNKESRELWVNILNYCLAFFMGLNLYILTIPLMSLLTPYVLFKLTRKKIKPAMMLMLGLMLMSIAMSLFVGLFDNYGESLGYSVYLFVLFFVLVGFIYVSKEDLAYRFIVMYSFGVFVKNIFLIHYACVYLGGIYGCGYGDIYNVFTNGNSNTPGIANSLAVFPTICCCYILIKDSKKIIFPLALSFIFLAVLYLSFLSSRAGYILLSLGLLASTVLGGGVTKVKFWFLVLVFSLVVYLLYSIFIIDSDFYNFDYVLQRFSEKGVGSQRSERYAAAFYELIKTPVGIYHLPYEVADNNLVHNIYFDLAKFGGWFVFISAFLLTILGIFWFSFKETLNFKVVFVLYLVTLAALQQDVFYGGGLPVLVVFLLSLAYLLSFGKRRFKF